MAHDFKNSNEILKHFHLEFQFEKFINFDSTHSVGPDEKFKAELDFSLMNRGEDDKEAFACEFLIVPFLKETWMRHPKVSLFSHVTIKVDDFNLVPDYLVATKPSTGIKSLDKPLLLTTEAKNEKFDEGWFQALQQLIACQKINKTDKITIYAIVTTGDIWQFGKLEKHLFSRHPVSVSLDNTGKLLGILDFLFSECEKNMEIAVRSEK
ncbi:MAG: hypothetical protein GY749_00915 [Desulfobacteraceae bacterium]|nr:hypothetical protein [Desulfobacteraceae bacterium]